MQYLNKLALATSSPIALGTAPNYISLDEAGLINPVFLFELEPAAESVGLRPLSYDAIGSGTALAGSDGFASGGAASRLFYSDIDYTAPQVEPPVLDLDLMQEDLDSRVSWTRNRAALYINESGQIYYAAAGQSRLQYDFLGNKLGRLLEPARINSLANPEMTGAVTGVVGSGGALPTGWGRVMQGLTMTIVSSTTITVGPFNYNVVRLQISGTATGTGDVDISLGSNTAITATAGQSWTASIAMRLVSGGPQTGRIKVQTYTAGGTQVQSSNPAATQLSTNWQWFERVNPSLAVNSERVNGTIGFAVTSGLTYNFTVDVMLPQVEQGIGRTSCILTDGVNRSRPADIVTINEPNLITAVERTVRVVAYVDALYGIPMHLISLDDGSSNNRITCRLDSNYQMGLDVITSGASQASLGTIAALARQPFVFSLRVAANNFARANADGSFGSDTSGTIPAVTTMRLGSGPAGNEYIGCMQRVQVWLRAQPDVRLVQLASLSMPNWASPQPEWANRHYIGCAGGAVIEQSLPLYPEADTVLAVTAGTLEILNTDGALDIYNSGYSFDGRPARIKLLSDTSQTPADAVTLFDGQMVSIDIGIDKATVVLRDSGFGLEVPLLSTFSGLGDGDGTADSAGKPIPQCYGLCRNITAELVDPARQIYRFHDRQAEAVDAVYDRGAPIAIGTGYGSYRELRDASTAAGTFDWALTSTGSYWRLGSNPSGLVTADVRGDSFGGYVATTATILRRLAERVLPTTRLNLDSFERLAGKVPGTIGFYMTEQVSVAGALSSVARAAACYIGDLGDRTISCGRLEPPSFSGYSYDESSIWSVPEALPLPDIFAPAIWRCRVSYRKNYTPMTQNDLVPAPTIAESRRKELNESAKVATANAASRLLDYRQAKDPAIIESLFDSEADAIGLAQHLVALYAPGRRLIQFTTGMSGYNIRLGDDTIALTYPRLGLSPFVGRPVKVRRDGARHQVTLFG